MSGDGEEDLAAFVALHGAALRASGVPGRYWESLCRKLRGEVRGCGLLRGGAGTALREAPPTGSEGPRTVFPSVRRRWGVGSTLLASPAGYEAAPARAGEGSVGCRLSSRKPRWGARPPLPAGLKKKAKRLFVLQGSVGKASCWLCGRDCSLEL